MRSALVATIAVGALGAPVPAQADPVCVPGGTVKPPDGIEIEICVGDHNLAAAVFSVWVGSDHVASGWANLRPPDESQVYVYDDSTAASVSAGVVTDPETGERSLEVCVELAAAELISPIEECRSRRLP